MSIIKPLIGKNKDVPAEATVFLAELDRLEGIVLAEGINPFLSDFDTFYMAEWCIDLAVRRVLSIGGDISNLAGLDNFCWPDPVKSDKTPDGEYKLAQLVRANQALYECTKAFQIPLISGKDSMKNDAIIAGEKISIPPTLLFSIISFAFPTSPFTMARCNGDVHPHVNATNKANPKQKTATLKEMDFFIVFMVKSSLLLQIR